MYVFVKIDHGLCAPEAQGRKVAIWEKESLEKDFNRDARILEIQEVNGHLIIILKVNLNILMNYG